MTRRSKAAILDVSECVAAKAMLAMSRMKGKTEKEKNGADDFR